MVDRRNPLPLHAQVADAIREQIRRGDLTPGERLPLEVELADVYTVNRTTVRVALAQLRAEGWVRTIHGRGSYAARPARRRRVDTDLTTPGQTQRGFYAMIAALGLTPNVQTDVSHGRAPADVADLLGIPAGEIVLIRHRTMGAQGEPPMQIATSYVPAHVETVIPVLAEMTTGPGGMLARFEDAGWGPLAFSETLSVRKATAAELDAGLSEVVMDATGMNYAHDGRPLHVMRRAIDQRCEQHYTFGAPAAPDASGEGEPGNDR